MRPLILLVGFLGTGKTTFIRRLLPQLRGRGLVPHVVLNDYENAEIDAATLRGLSADIQAISGSCVCCDSRDSLFETLSAMPGGPGDVVVAEANGTTDPLPLLEGLACDERTRRFHVLQVVMIDAQRWQMRRQHNFLEQRQVLTASHYCVSYLDLADPQRAGQTMAAVKKLNPRLELTDAKGVALEAEKIMTVPDPFRPFLPPPGRGDPSKRFVLTPTAVKPATFQHSMAHAFTSAELIIPPLVEEGALERWLVALPSEALRVKGITRLTRAPEELCSFQRVDDWVDIRCFPMAPDYELEPRVVLIGSRLPAGELQAQADAALRVPVNQNFS